MDYKSFYKTLFAPLTANLGPSDENTIFAIIGFDASGPLNFCTFGANSGENITSYVSCELAVRAEQIPTKQGGYRYEMVASCDDERWVRNILTRLGRMSLEMAFDHGHTADIGPIVNQSGITGTFLDETPLQGVLFHRECTASYEGVQYGILRCIGITRPEMEFAMSEGADSLVSRLKEYDIWPNTLVNRESIIF